MTQKIQDKVKYNHFEELPIMYGSVEVGKKKKLCKTLWFLNFIKNVITKKKMLTNLDTTKKIEKKYRRKKNSNNLAHL